MRDFIRGFVVLVLWAAYFGASGFIVYQIYEGDPHGIMKNYMFGMATIWVMIGFGLWQLTDEL